MANSTDKDLMSLGQHCSVDHCCQVDFLPFTCDCCERVFCLEHRTYASHQCPNSGSKQTEVIVCPLCAKGVRLIQGEDANITFDRHASQDCDPSNYAKVHKKPKCPVKNCKEKLTSINTYHCKACDAKVCLKHRLQDDHSCTELQAEKRARAAQAATHRNMFAAAQGFFRPKPTIPSVRQDQQALRAAAAKQYEDPANSVKGTVERRKTPPPAPRPPPPQSNANPLVPPHLPEVCPQCNARFASVERLVQHVEEYHPSQPPSQPRSPAIDLTQSPQSAPSYHNPAYQNRTAPSHAAQSEAFECPKCKRRFGNAVQLVQHSEACGQSSATDKCVIA